MSQSSRLAQPQQLAQNLAQTQTLHPCVSKQRLLFGVLAGGMIGLVLSFSSIAQAGYVQPDSSDPPPETGSTGVRGDCGKAWPEMLTALAPVGYMGQTSSTHPTFAWYVSSQKPDSIESQKSYPMEFRLYEYQKTNPTRRGKPIQTIPLQVSFPGFMQIALDKTQSGLVEGKTYRWQIVLLCNPNRPSQNPRAEMLMKVVALPGTVKAALAKTNDRRQRADLYASAGFWYEALAETLPPPASKQPILKDQTLSLLQDLVRLEKGEPQRKLKQVVAIERPGTRVP